MNKIENVSLGRLLMACLLCILFYIPLTAQVRPDSGYSSLYDGETAAMMRRHVSWLSSAEMEGRKAGSQGETASAVYMYDILKDYGVDMLSPRDGDIFGMKLENGDTLTSRNVIGFIQGYDLKLKDRYIVVGARLDNLGVNHLTIDGRPAEQIYYGANGNASGLAMMAELARMVATNSVMFRRSVIFIAFGASCEGMAGSWYFLDRSFKDVDRIDAMINLDMLGTGDRGFYAYTASNSDLNKIIGNLGNQLQPIKPELDAAEPYPSDHRSFYSKEIPAVMLTTGRYTEHNTPRDTGSIIDYDMMERELEYVYNLTYTMANLDKAPSFRPEEVAVKKMQEDVVSYNDCDQRPSFLNSTDPAQFMQKWVYQYLRYPGQAVEEGISGRVMVNFIIEKNGAVTNVTVVKGVHPLLDEEAVRVISASPKWKAGKVKGEKVRTAITLPVEFRLEKKSQRRSFGIKK
ncbi:MAG: TonB family protein [Candidatus Cryptobacteroides sp.]